MRKRPDKTVSLRHDGRLANKTQGVVLFSDFKYPKIHRFYSVGLILFALFVIAVALPPLWVILSSFKSREEFFRVPPTFIPETFRFQEIINTWNQLNFFKYYANSLIVVAGSVVCAMLFNALLAFVLGQVKPMGYKIVRTAIVVSLMIPATTSLVPLFSNVVGVRQLFFDAFHVDLPRFLPLWLAAGANGFYTLLYLSFNRSLPPSILEAAEIDGCGNARVFSHIIMPLSGPINIVVAIYAINAAWGDFLFPYVVLFSDKYFTVMVKLYVMRDAGMVTLDQLIRCVAFAIVPPIILFIIFQRWITEGSINAGIKE